ncbi:KN motif and ankyrin repeat domain-containing protein 1a isoform X1 [Scleropages formosus]|uniref:KN motif and ankyrin repeat domains 1a n=1 Tax=Scleropages formosus TaxID=113540 RepID=A0A8C9RP71_SCLFO|nr:KN motif and ankyrin repeat domain-containing protein 1-like isoform X1 [Scleropages formosus]XP_018614733.2 KN motif and ankyrin repeat domain-containing protein 1-like isoform X1 [Scleropages formosus]
MCDQLMECHPLEFWGKSNRGASADDDRDSAAPYYLETPYGFQLDLDFLKYVDDIEKGNTIRRLNIQRKHKVPLAGASSSGSRQTEWTSYDSLSSSNSDESKLSPVFSVSRSQPTSLPSAKVGPVHESTPACLSLPEGKLLPPASPGAERPNLQVEKTLMETRLRLEQERLLVQPVVTDAPRRRLATFGGMGSSSSLSSFTGSSGQNQISPNSQLLLNNGQYPNGEYNPYLTPSMCSSIRHSPVSSGMATPVTNVSPVHLQQIREQMVVALKRLKELEEQIKTIPVLQVKISVLQEEKRQLTAQIKNQKLSSPGQASTFRKRAYSAGNAEHFEQMCQVRKGSELHIDSEDELDRTEKSSQRLEEFRQLTAEMQALEKKIQDNTSEGEYYLTQNVEQKQCVKERKSIAVGTDENMNDTVIYQKLPKELRDVAVGTEVKQKSTAVGVTEAMLGLTTEVEAELEMQQQTIESLKDKIYRLEVQLKESMHEMEMSKLKLELQVAGSRKKVDKGSMIKPDIRSVAVEATVQMQSQGTENYTVPTEESRVPLVHSVGVSCRPEWQHVAVGSELPMDQWIVQKRVDAQDQCVGRHIVMSSQSSGMQRSVCETGTNTENSVDYLGHGKTGLDQMTNIRPVESRDCSVDMKISPPEGLISVGTVTTLVNTVDFGIMAVPQTASQHTNTVIKGVSKFTNTENPMYSESSTSTTMATHEQHKDTAPVETKTVAVGDGLVKDVGIGIKVRSVAVGTSAPSEPSLEKSHISKTKDTGVGLTSINENFLVGLKTRNIACGPSCLSSPGNLRSIGVGGDSVSEAELLHSHPGKSAGLDHYIERVQKLLQEQQMLLAENYSELADTFGQPHSQISSINSQLVSTLSSINSAMKHGSAEQLNSVDIFNLCPDSSSAMRDVGDVKLASRVRTEVTHIPSGTFTCQQTTALQKCVMDEQMSSALHGQLCSQSTLKSIIKNKDGQQCSGETKKNLQFVGVNGGYETTSSDESSSDSSSSGSEEEDEGKVYGEEKGIQKAEGKLAELCTQRAGEESTGGELQGLENPDMPERHELSEKMMAACTSLKNHLDNAKAFTSKEVRACLNTVQQEWFRVSSQKQALPTMVEAHLVAFRAISPALLQHVVNMTDGNGNTALHYSVSHSNFDIVKKLLDADVCNVDQQNKAGYTPIMLAALAAVETQKDMRVVEELFGKGDVNAKASQAGQTALMLAVSHGRMDMVKALLACGADVNIQDDEGSTALMCASEHGHAEIVKLLLAQPGCDATLSDNDESNALSIALEAGHKDIAVLLYAHVNFSKAQSPGTPRLGRKTSPSPTRRSVFH